MTKEPCLARDPHKTMSSFTTICSQSVPSTHIPNEVTFETDSSKWLSLTPKSSTLSDRPRACRRRTSSTLRSAPLISRESPSSTSRATRSSSRPRLESESNDIVYGSEKGYLRLKMVYAARARESPRRSTSSTLSFSTRSSPRYVDLLLTRSSNYFTDDPSLWCCP